jgi:YVTN family beta-propeller protein
LACDKDEPPANTVITTIDTGHTPTGMVRDSQRGVIYVANSGDSTVVAVDERTNTVTAIIPVGEYPFDLGFDPFRRTLYVSNYLSGNVSVIDEATNTVTATIAFPANSYPRAVAVDPFRGKAYVGVAGQTTDYVAVIDEATNAVTKTIELPALGLRGIGNEGFELGVDTLRGTLYLTAGSVGPYEVYVIDERTDTITASIPMPGETIHCAVDPVKGLVYVANSGYVFEGTSTNGSVVVINEETNTVIANITDTSINSPNGVAIDPVTGTVYVANYGLANGVKYGYGSVVAIDERTNAVTATIPLGGAVNDVVVDPVRGIFYASNWKLNNVVVISAGGPKCLRDDWRDPFGDFLGDRSKR